MEDEIDENDDVWKTGISDGEAHGESLALVEGAGLGRLRGSELGAELGLMKGTLVVWLHLASVQGTGFCSAKALKSLIDVSKALDAFPHKVFMFHDW